MDWSSGPKLDHPTQPFPTLGSICWSRRDRQEAHGHRNSELSSSPALKAMFYVCERKRERERQPDFPADKRPCHCDKLLPIYFPLVSQTCSDALLSCISHRTPLCLSAGQALFCHSEDTNFLCRREAEPQTHRFLTLRHIYASAVKKTLALKSCACFPVALPLHKWSIFKFFLNVLH